MIYNKFKSSFIILTIFLGILSTSPSIAKQENSSKEAKLPYNIHYSSDKPLNQQILILTDFGPIVIILNSEQAPNSTSLFVNLIRSDYYKNTSFYRMYNNYFIQAGDPYESGIGNAGVQFPCEHQNQTALVEGSVALANNNTDINSTSSQFFITFVRSTWLDGKYTVIGKVISGLDILRSFFGKYETDYKGIMHTSIPFQIFVLEDYMNSHPEYQSQFIATKFDKKSLLNELLNSSPNNTVNNTIYNINIFQNLDNLLPVPFNLSISESN